ncbi:helix-turn-helix domain-containing protein [Nonomuraea sp. NPDC055795]
MELALHTATYPVAERFERWQELVSASMGIAVATTEPLRFSGSMRGLQSDGIIAARVAVSPNRSSRSATMVRRADPETVHVIAVRRGAATVNQRGDAAIRPTELALYTSWRPSVVHAYADEPALADGLLAVVPYERLAVRRDLLERLTATAFPASRGIGALLVDFVSNLAAASPGCSAADEARLSGVLSDLLTAWLAHTLDRTGALSADTRPRAVLVQVQAFIRDHLGDPALTPSAVAAAHHMSLRSLQRLFGEHGHTVAHWIRHLRLERCRRDLADPRLSALPIHAIATRWGYPQPAHFTRAFRVAYGQTPSRFRATFHSKM